jgi:hypothetical protein
LAVPTGTSLKVGLDQEVRVQKVGQPVHGKIVAPVYAFDKLVIPAGTEVLGKISAIDRVPKTRRTVAAMNGEFSPPRQVHIDFSELVMADGRHVPLQADISPGAGGVLQFVPASEREKQKESKKDEARNAASRRIDEARSEVKRQWDAAKKQLHEPGKMHRSGGADMGSGAANGASGFRLVGTIVGAFAHSRVVASGFGFYGAAMSVYSHFLARGRDVVYPKDMSMMIGLGTREKQPVAGAEPATNPSRRNTGPL